MRPSTRASLVGAGRLWPMGSPGAIAVRRADREDTDWVVGAARRQLGSEHQVHSRRQFRVDEHELLVAETAGVRVGFLAWIVDDDGCEVLAVASEAPRAGVGSALMEAVD